MLRICIFIAFLFLASYSSGQNGQSLNYNENFQENFALLLTDPIGVADNKCCIGSALVGISSDKEKFSLILDLIGTVRDNSDIQSLTKLEKIFVFLDFKNGDRVVARVPIGNLSEKQGLPLSIILEVNSTSVDYIFSNKRELTKELSPQEQILYFANLLTSSDIKSVLLSDIDPLTSECTFIDRYLLEQGTATTFQKMFASLVNKGFPNYFRTQVSSGNTQNSDVMGKNGICPPEKRSGIQVIKFFGNLYCMKVGEDLKEIQKNETITAVIDYTRNTVTFDMKYYGKKITYDLGNATQYFTDDAYCVRDVYVCYNIYTTSSTDQEMLALYMEADKGSIVYNLQDINPLKCQWQEALKAFPSRFSSANEIIGLLQRWTSFLPVLADKRTKK